MGLPTRHPQPLDHPPRSPRSVQIRALGTLLPPPAAAASPLDPEMKLVPWTLHSHVSAIFHYVVDWVMGPLTGWPTCAPWSKLILYLLYMWPMVMVPSMGISLLVLKDPYQEDDHPLARSKGICRLTMAHRYVSRFGRTHP